MASAVPRDNTPRYVPSKVMTPSGLMPVAKCIIHPPGEGRIGVPIRPDLTAIQACTRVGSRWYGCEQAYKLGKRTVVVGFDARDSVRRTWEVARGR